MCDFISWVERRGKVYFLTGEQLLSEKGQVWCKEHGVSPDDYCGHGTIRRYYGIDSGDGRDKECTNFSNPSNFPPEITRAIKVGEFRGLGLSPALLSPKARAEYDKVEQQARAEYDKVEQQARAEYDKVVQQAWAEYDKVVQQAWAEYDKVVQQARAEYDKVVQQARAECDKVVQQAFWDLFAISNNRAKAWR